MGGFPRQCALAGYRRKKNARTGDRTRFEKKQDLHCIYEIYNVYLVKKVPKNTVVFYVPLVAFSMVGSVRVKKLKNRHPKIENTMEFQKKLEPPKFFSCAGKKIGARPLML